MNIKEKSRRNWARIQSCRCHQFNWKDDMRRAIERKRSAEERYGVTVGITIPVFCRCKNCGGKVPILYAVGYMDAITHTSTDEKEAHT